MDWLGSFSLVIGDLVLERLISEHIPVCNANSNSKLKPPGVRTFAGKINYFYSTV